MSRLIDLDDPSDLPRLRIRRLENSTCVKFHIKISLVASKYSILNYSGYDSKITYSLHKYNSRITNFLVNLGGKAVLFLRENIEKSRLLVGEKRSPVLGLTDKMVMPSTI